ncbi:DUF4419 domain-containing protein [Dactylosporangium sp. NPDC000244]|uniref:DUF4419 domain-containing protein n=1 Tax=Dactylosporangium sp. NPDC000244 TaxID=3154365 RepID=UPI00331E0708
MMTFAVDDVTPAAEPLPTRPAGGLFPDALAFGGDPARAVLEPDGVHPLLGAVARAFAEHRPLVLSPDAVWLTIAQGVAQHIRLHAEELRPRLVRHEGRKRLTITVDGELPRDADGWADLTESFGKLLAAEVDDELFACDFSTSTDVERTAGRIVLLDAYSPYFALWVTTVCGIPSLTLDGTVEDWRRIRARIDAVAGFGLEQWCRSLAPIADEFVRAAAGTPDADFWRRIYNPADAYGGDKITGWITRFYPYLTGARTDRPNPMLELPIGEPRDVTPTPDGVYWGPGISSDSVPATLSRVIVNVNDQSSGDNYAVALHAGLIGVAQDPDGALRPIAGWYVAPAPVEIDAVLDRLVREHTTTPPSDEAEHREEGGPADLLALYGRVGSATLFDGAWHLVPAAEWRRIEDIADDWTARTLIELPDGRWLALAVDYTAMRMHWIVCRVRSEEVTPYNWTYTAYFLADDPADVPVLGTSLAMVLDAAMDSGGDIAHLETARLADLLPQR